MALIDLASIGLFLGGASGNSLGLVGFSGATFALGPPMVHLFNHHPYRALASLGIRTLAEGIAVGAVFADLVGNYCDHDGNPNCSGPILGFSIGAAAILAAMIVDDALLARETVPPHPSVTGSFAPGVAIGQHSAFVSLGGRF